MQEDIKIPKKKKKKQLKDKEGRIKMRPPKLLISSVIEKKLPLHEIRKEYYIKKEKEKRTLKFLKNGSRN